MIHHITRIALVVLAFTAFVGCASREERTFKGADQHFREATYDHRAYELTREHSLNDDVTEMRRAWIAAVKAGDTENAERLYQELERLLQLQESLAQGGFGASVGGVPAQSQRTGIKFENRLTSSGAPNLTFKVLRVEEGENVVVSTQNVQPRRSRVIWLMPGSYIVQIYLEDDLLWENTDVLLRRYDGIAKIFSWDDREQRDYVAGHE